MKIDFREYKKKNIEILFGLCDNRIEVWGKVLCLLPFVLRQNIETESNTIMRKILTVIIAAVVICLFMLTGCSKQIETITGTWASPDGYTMTLTESTMTLTGEQGESSIAYDSLPYRWADNVLYVTVGDIEYPMFTTYLSENDLQMTYIPETLGVSASDVRTINLIRTEK